jgi:APA family basic amino acid/polyamine antiporter
MTQLGLERKVGLFAVTNIVIANMIGAGIFTTSGLLMQGLHDPLLMLTLWFLGGVVALCGAMSYAELGATMPEAGGEYAFLSRLYHPLLGFLSGWVSLIAGFSAPIAASAIGCSEYALRAFPSISDILPGPAEVSVVWAKRLLALLVIVLFTLIHLRGIEFGSRVQNGLTILKVSLIGGLIVAGFAFGSGDWAHFTATSPLASTSWSTIGLSLMWIMFAYSGWNAATYIGSEIRNPVRTLPRALLVGTAVVSAFYILLNLFYVYAIDPQSMTSVVSIAGLAVGRSFGQVPEYVVSTLIAFALFSSLSAYVILGPRVYYAMAKDRLFFRSLAVVNPTSRAPGRAILLQGAISSVLVVTGSFDQILTYMGFSLGIFPLLCVAGVFRLRRRQESLLPLPGYPVIPFVYLLAGTIMLVLSYIERPLESSLAVGTVLAGIPVYFWFRNRRHIPR